MEIWNCVPTDGQALRPPARAAPRARRGRPFHRCLENIEELLLQGRHIARDQRQAAIPDRLASVGTLAAGVAREIHKPLAASVANLELMSRDSTSIAPRLDLTDRLHEVFDELSDAREGADRLRHIVRDRVR